MQPKASMERAVHGLWAVIGLLLCFGLGFQPAKAESVSSSRSGIETGRSYHNDVSPPLGDLADRRPYSTSTFLLPLATTATGSVDHSILQFLVPEVMPPTILNFDGIAFPGSCNCSPPNTNGEVGATQYVQVAGQAFQVFDKATGVTLIGPITVASLWTGFGGTCQSFPTGNATVLYDQLAGRWIVTQSAGIELPTDQCVAVSTTNDATGTWNRYAFHLGSNYFDSPRLGVWPDGYYMSMNVFNSAGTTFLGPQAFAFERAKILAGSAATFITTGITSGPEEASYLPADFDGSVLPPANAPNPFVEFPAHGTYQVFHFHADFATPNNSTFTLFSSPTAGAFTPLCPGTRNCIPQLGTGSMLDGVTNRLMPRLAYRNLGTSENPNESVIGNFSVSSGGVSGVHWFELKNVTAGTVKIAQESTYQPDDTWRWLGSAAMDQHGNLAIGFSASSSSINPQIRYAGRLATDPPNTLAQGEAHIFNGLSSQNSNGWGDLSAMSIDPDDDCTFWYTNEYVATSPGWRTRIANFKFAECTNGPSPTPSVTPTATPSPTPSITPGPTPTSTPTASPTERPSPTVTATPSSTSTPTPTPAVRLLNVSTRLRIESGDGVGIAGFIITGNAPKDILLRGLGPQLGSLGIPDSLADPVIELHGPTGFATIINDNWKDDNQQSAIKATGLAPAFDAESAILTTLSPGSYTVVIKGKNNGAGVGLVEVFDIHFETTQSSLSNISTRGFVGTEVEIMIAGFILHNDNWIVVRGLGPSLAQFGVPDTLADPKIELRDLNGTLLRENDDWKEDPIGKVGVFGLGPSEPHEAAFALILPPGMYTALLVGVDNGIGNGLVEVYDLSGP
jgi:hypothetical protein